MKKICLFIFLAFLFVRCSDDDNPSSTVEQLPAITQTGANTFGCLVNGEVFLPKGNPLGGPILSAAYQNVDGKMQFRLFSINEQQTIKSIIIGAIDVELATENPFILAEEKENSLFAEYSKGNTSQSISYSTTETTGGILTITRLDETSRIISGTFSFDAIAENGNTVEIRQGRFDLKYTI